MALRLLVADDDLGARTLLGGRARETLGEIEVLEAADGAEAVQLALEQRPQIALLDVNMPRLDGLAAALVLRELRPEVCVALQTADAAAHREDARACGLPLFDKRHVDRAVAWVAAQTASVPRRSLTCSACGYGIVRALPPDRCPMCHIERAWRTVKAHA